MAAGGSDALEWDSERSKNGKAARDWLRTKANSIEGGTSEIQLEHRRQAHPWPSGSLRHGACSPTTRRCCRKRRRASSPRKARSPSSSGTGATPAAPTDTERDLLEAVRRAWPDRHLHSGGPGRARARRGRGRAGAGGDRSQPDAVALPDDCGRRRRARSRARLMPSAGIRASCPARRCLRSRSMRAAATRRNRPRLRPSAGATASS